MSEKPIQEQFRKYVNPLKIPDGHCASCAFNTYLLLMGYIKPAEAEAFEPGGAPFKKFGDWFYKKFMLDTENNVILSFSVTSTKNQTIKDFEEFVSSEILNNTKPGEAVIICLDEGTHWYNAYHSPDKKVIFIDSQTGIEFNVYGSFLYDDTTIKVIIPKEEVIKEYLADVLPKIKETQKLMYQPKGGKKMRKQKKRKTNKKKIIKKKTKKHRRL
jgi:hypothetical protein